MDTITPLYEKVERDVSLLSIKNRLMNFLPPKIGQILENKFELQRYFDDSEDAMVQMLSFVQIIVDDFSPDPVFDLSINYPIICLDFKDLVLE